MVGLAPNVVWSNFSNSYFLSILAKIHLMLGIAIRLESHQGVSELNPNVNLLEFFSSQVFPELQDNDHSKRQLVKATALKFVCTFRKQFTQDQLKALMPLLIHHLSSPSVVVHTLAAYGIERILMTTEEGSAGVKQYKISRADLNPFLEGLFTGLFAIIDNTEWNENEHVMKCTMRTLARAGSDVIPVTGIVFSKLSAALERVCKNPRNPSYNHYLFESIAALVRNCCSADSSMTSQLEQLLFPPFQTVLQMDILEFTPYVFQVLAQLLEYRPEGSGLGPAYTSLFPPLLTASLWEKRGNVPGLVRLLQAYLKRAAPELLDHLLPMLGIFQNLNASKATEASAFDLLSAITRHVPQSALGPRFRTIFTLILTKLSAAKSNTKYGPLAISYFALFAGLFGGQALLNSLNEIQAGIGLTILVQVWVPKLSMIPANRIDSKIQVVGLTRILCDTPDLISDDNGKQVWSQAFKGVVTILSSQSFRSQGVEDDGETEVEIGYDATYSQLSLAAKKPDDPFPEVADPPRSFASALSSLSSQRPGVLGTVIQHSLSSDPKLADGFQKLLQTSGANIA